MKASRMALGGLCLWVLGGVDAAGAVLAPPTVSWSVFFNFTPPPRIDFDTFGTFSQSGLGGMVQFSSMATPAPSLLAEVEVNTGYYGRSSGMLVYEMQITRPAGSVPVNVQVAGSAGRLFDHDLSVRELCAEGALVAGECEWGAVAGECGGDQYSVFAGELQ